MSKRVLVRFKGRRTTTFSSIREAVSALAILGDVSYTYPEKSGRVHLESLVKRVPSVTSFRILKGK